MSIQKFLHTKFESFCEFMEHDTRGVEIGIYTVSGLLFAVAYYKRRPITKFVKPSDIPNYFIKNKVPQIGYVAKVDPSASGPLLMVQHKPPVNIFFSSKKTLPVQISGIEVNSNGFSWLQSVVANQHIDFIPISINSTAAECKVILNYKDKNKRNLDLAESLLGLGLARSTAVAVHDPYLHKYYKSLPAIEKLAKNKRMGMWYTSLPPPILPVRIFRFACCNVINSVTPPAKRLPEILR